MTPGTGWTEAIKSRLDIVMDKASEEERYKMAVLLTLRHIEELLEDVLRSHEPPRNSDQETSDPQDGARAEGRVEPT